MCFADPLIKTNVYLCSSLMLISWHASL